MEERDSQKGFGGLLHGLDIRNLIQICAVNGITGRVQIETDDERGEIYFEKGEIVHSACGDLQGVESLRRIIGWEGGEIRLEPGVPPPAVTVDVPWQALLLAPAINPQETEVKEEEEEEAPLPPAKSQASETLLVYRLYSEILSWQEVSNCILYSLEKREVVRPSTPVPRMHRWAEALQELYNRCNALSPFGRHSLPVLISAVLEGRLWALMNYGPYLFALEIPRTVDLREIHLRFLRTAEELK